MLPPSGFTSFHRQVTSERRFGMSSPSSVTTSCGGGSTSSSLPIPTGSAGRDASPAQAIIPSTSPTSSTTFSNSGGGGVQHLYHQSSLSTSPPFSSFSPGSGSGFSPPDPQQAQKSILEHLLDRELVEGDFWYVIVAEWLEQLKKFMGISSGRNKYYKSQRATSPPGPIVTRRDYAHTVDVVHEDAWRSLVQWYGIADGHKAMKLVVYRYTRGPEIEHNVNSFKIMLSNSPPEDFHIVRFSKMEKVGYVEHRARQLYQVCSGQRSRLWAKAEADTDWQPLLYREKPIGNALDMDSDFTRPVLVLELTNAQGEWAGSPEGAEFPDDEDGDVGVEDGEPHGYLVENSMFDDVTTQWELNIHEQIEQVGRSFMEKLHGNFNVFMQRAKDHMEARECQLRSRERQVCARESVTDRLAAKLTVKEQRLDEQLARCEEKIKEYESLRLDLERKAEERREEQEKFLEEKEGELRLQKEELLAEKEKFREELKRMTELGKVQESRIKLDIGGHVFTTSLLTLTKDPDSMLAAMFSGRHELKNENDGSFFIDRDGTHFRYLLNYLRDGCVKEGTLPQSEAVWRELRTEAEFYQLRGLEEYLKDLLEKRDAEG